LQGLSVSPCGGSATIILTACFLFHFLFVKKRKLQGTHVLGRGLTPHSL